MKQFFINIRLYVLLLLVFSSCSSSKQSKPLSLATINSPHLQISEKTTGDHLFSEIKSQAPGSTLIGYATAIRTCGYSEKSSLRGTTRQIFVGLEKLSILKQEPIELASQNMWAVEAEALSEGFPILIASYTLKENQCFTDFILWAPNHSVSIEKGQMQKEFDQLRASFQSLVADTLQEHNKQSS